MDITKYIKGDKVIWMVIVLLSFFSLLAVYSSTGSLAYKYQAGNTEYYLIKHLFILILAFIIIYLVHKVKYVYFSRIAQIALYLSIPLLAFTLLFGSNINQASRWLTLPILNLSFQTSDLAKIALMMYLARILAKKQDNIKDLKEAFIPIILPVVIICGLILPANLSTAASLFLTSLIVMFIGRVNLKYIGAMIGIGFIGLLLVFIIGKAIPDAFPRLDTWIGRIESFTSDGKEGSSNFQVDQSKIAIATGGLFGKGPGNSSQRNFLPHPYSDFIYSIVVEEYGLVGAAFTVLLYLILLYRAVRIVQMSESTFGALLAIGCCFSIVFQAMINMAVAVNIFPVTGQSLPFVSMGGTSIWFSSVAIGILLSISRQFDDENVLEEANKEDLNSLQIA